MAIENTSQDLADFLATKNFEVRYADEKGQDSSPEEASVFSFDWVASSGKNYGTVVIVLGDDNDFQLFFGDNLGRTMDDPADKLDWFGSERHTGFLQELKNFATSHRYLFSPKNLNQLKHTMQGMAAIKEGLFEGYYGTRTVSYVGERTEARLMIRHNRALGEDDKRYRYVESLFIETADGERFRLPFTKLTGGRAMLEHVRQGGKPYDIRGQHICEIVSEMAVLSRFNRARQGRVFEQATQALVDSVNHYYQQLQENLRDISVRRGYSRYFESWQPSDITETSALVEDLKTLFVEQTLDVRIEAALPTLAKIQQQGRNMKEANIFEQWVNHMAEGTWALPDTPEAQAKLDELMSKELIVGPDATNATEQLYDVVGDDLLFDILTDLAEKDPRANIWDDTDVQARLQELGIQLNTTDQADQQQPVAPAAGQQPPGTSPEQVVREMDKSQDPPGRDGGIQFPPGPKVSKKDIKAVKKDPAKHLSDLLAKEYEKKKPKSEGVGTGIMDIVKRTYNDNVVDWPMGTPQKQFLTAWAQDIKDETGKSISLQTLANIEKEIIGKDVMSTHGTSDEPVMTYEQGVAEGLEDTAVIYDNGYVKIHGKMYKAKRMNHESGMGIAIQTPTKMYFSPIQNEYEMPSVTMHRALKLGGLNPVFNEGVAEGAGDVGSTIVDLYNQIYELGDDAVDHMYHRSSNFARYYDRFEGDIESMVAELPPKILAKIEQELRAAAAEEGLRQGVAEAKQLRWGYHIVDQQTGNSVSGTPKFKSRKEAQSYLMTNLRDKRHEYEVDEFQIKQGVAEAPQDPINYNAAITGSYYESKQVDLELDRLRKLALGK